VIVVGGMGSLPGAFIASILIGLMDAFAVGSDRSIADLARAFGADVGPATLGWTLLKVKVSQTAAILPYLLLVLVLIFRPKGLLGTREG
jgi:branched-chain amino acid transport system permease protein